MPKGSVVEQVIISSALIVILAVGRWIWKITAQDEEPKPPAKEESPEK